VGEKGVEVPTGIKRRGDEERGRGESEIGCIKRPSRS